MASAASAFITSQIRALWLQDIIESQQVHAAQAELGTCRAQALLGIGPLQYRFRFYVMTSGLILLGLMTATIVAGITPTAVPTSFVFPNIFFPGLSTPNNDCWAIEANNSLNVVGWQLPDGRHLFQKSTVGNKYCAAQNAVKLIDQTFVPHNYLYQAAGLSATGNALGTPFSIDPDNFGLDIGTRMVNTWATSDFLSLSTCVPNIIFNPVKCRRTGAITMTSNTTYDIRGDHYSGLDNTIPADLVNQDFATSRFCMSGSDVGTGYMVMGAFGDYARRVASYVSNGTTSDGMYSIECSIDIGSSFGFRTVDYELSEQGTRLHGSNQHCTPYTNASARSIAPEVEDVFYTSQLTTAEALATGVAALTYVMGEDINYDGWPRTFMSLVDRLSGSGMLAFPEQSTNVLEDAMGVAVAAVMGQFWGTANHGGDLDPGLVLTSNVAVMNSQRVGLGKPWAVVYVLPEVFAFALAVTFWVRRARRSKQ